MLFKTLILWSLSSSESVQAIIKESYKQQRHEDDLNQPLSVQPWGRDGDKRQFWLVEGQDDTHFRLYRESNPALKHNTWQSVAGSIEEVQQVAEKLEKEETQVGRRLAERIRSAILRFEAGEEVRSTNSTDTNLLLTFYRNGDGGTIGNSEKPNSRALSLVSRCTKDGRAASGSNTHSQMKGRRTRTRSRTGV